MGIGYGGVTRDRLEAFAALLAKWNPSINLVAGSTLGNLWTRHIDDSAQLFSLAGAGARSWADLGSGGGLPGMVIAILAAEFAPALRVTLVESDQRKAAFLRTVSRETSVAALVLADRAENLAPLRADVVSARALAPLTRLCGHAVRHLAPGGTALFPKGAQAEAEIETARQAWRFAVERFPSQTDSAGTILRLKEIAHV